MLLDGFVGPGHVSMVIGIHPYDFIARDYAKPIVVAGFEPMDLLQSVLMVLRQIRDGRAEVENQYARVVPEHGNPVSLAAIADVYEKRPSFAWRGLGEIDLSGLRVRAKYAVFDAEARFGIGYGAARARDVAEPEGTECAAVMRGKIKPTGCPMFGAACTPETPLGALMVSSEGACAAYWQYGGRRTSEAAE
jgi:hydrogenase expression/formation protein HypD